jgi:hypothetical protein
MKEPTVDIEQLTQLEILASTLSGRIKSYIEQQQSKLDRTRSFEFTDYPVIGQMIADSMKELESIDLGDIDAETAVRTVLMDAATTALKSTWGSAFSCSTLGEVKFEKYRCDLALMAWAACLRTKKNQEIIGSGEVVSAAIDDVRGQIDIEVQ